MIQEGFEHKDKVKGEHKSMERQTTNDKATNDVNLGERPVCLVEEVRSTSSHITMYRKSSGSTCDLK